MGCSSLPLLGTLEMTRAKRQGRHEQGLPSHESQDRAQSTQAALISASLFP